MSRLKFFIFLILLSEVSSDDLCDTKSITDIGTGITSTKENLCKTRACLYRYCQMPNSVLLKWKNGTQICLPMERVASITGNAFNMTSLNVYENHNEDLQLSKKGITDFKNVYFTNRNVYSENCSTHWRPVEGNLLEDGSYRIYIPNANEKFISLDAERFIMEYILAETNASWSHKAVLRMKLIKDLEDNSDNENMMFFNTIGMLVSCFFLLLVILVYSIFKELRNLSGMIVIAYAASFTLTFLVYAVQTMLKQKTGQITLCKYTIIIYYFGLLASFFWMNVLSFDIWWTIRGTRKLRPINRRGILHKFLMYCLYAFGFPLLLTIIAYVIDNVDDSDVIKPRIDACLYGGDDNFIMFLYVYVPMIILMTANIIFFLMTCYNIWWLKRDIQRTYSADKNMCNNQSRFLMYLRLFMIMGISWISDIVSNRVKYPIYLQYIANGYNALIGVFIFINFICNRKVLCLLRKRYPKADEFISTLQYTASRMSSTKNNSMSCNRDDSSSVPR